MEKAEDPEKLVKQLLLDMENQLLQVKTQVAIAIADQHLLEKKQKEHEALVQEWHRKAGVAVDKHEDDLARAALERSLSHERLAEGFVQQLEDQRTETETLRGAFLRLQQKLAETQSAAEILMAQRRRAKTIGRAHGAHAAFQEEKSRKVLGKLRSSLETDEMGNIVSRKLLEGQSLDDRFTAMEREDRVEQLLEDLKNRQRRLA